MYRRQLLRGATAAGAGLLAGCLSGGDDVVLSAPEDRQYDSDELPYPAHGQAFPGVSLPDPLSGERVDTDTLEETLVVTAFFATCPAECVQLIDQLAGVQAGTIEDGIAEDVRFLAITFDPERDDAEALREYGARMPIDMSAGNWQFLRPPDPETASEVVEDRLGITFDRIGAEQSQRVSGYDFRHLSLTFLVNPDDYVERAYRTQQPDAGRVLDDVHAVVEGS